MNLVAELRRKDAEWQKQCDEWLARIAEMPNTDPLPPETIKVMRFSLHALAADEIERLNAVVARLT